MSDSLKVDYARCPAQHQPVARTDISWTLILQDEIICALEKFVGELSF
jgi:hypothetical protein